MARRRHGRIICQVGDSTDGEEYEGVEDGYWINRIKNLLKSQSLYPVSHALKSMGECILQSPSVREHYAKLKLEVKNLHKRSDRLDVLDEGIGRPLEYLIPKYLREDQDYLRDYFRRNEGKIRTSLSKKNLHILPEPERAAEAYLDSLKVADAELREIHELHEECDESAQRSLAEPSFEEEHEDASLFLAKLKLSWKLDRNLGKNALFKFRSGTLSGVCEKSTQQGEFLLIYDTGSFSHKLEGDCTYLSIVENLLNNWDEIGEGLSQSLKMAIRGRIEAETEEAAKIIQNLVKVVFGIDAKRNPAALLTAPMFFELVDAGEYKISDMSNKMPMAMDQAVPASVLINGEGIKENPSRFRSVFDYRSTVGVHASHPEPDKDLGKREELILRDWLKLMRGLRLDSEDVTDVKLRDLHDLVERWYGISLDSLKLDVTPDITRRYVGVPRDILREERKNLLSSSPPPPSSISSVFFSFSILLLLVLILLSSSTSFLEFFPNFLEDFP